MDKIIIEIESMLKRYDDDERVDFRRITSGDKVLFTFSNGFFMVVDGMITKEEIEEYIEAAIK